METKDGSNTPRFLNAVRHNMRNRESVDQTRAPCYQECQADRAIQEAPLTYSSSAYKAGQMKLHHRPRRLGEHCGSQLACDPNGLVPG